MAVHCNLSTLMGRKRYSIQDVHILTGLSRSTVSSLYNDKATRISQRISRSSQHMYGRHRLHFMPE